MIKTTPTLAADMLEEGARTFRERAAIYGDNYLVIGTLFDALFPKGIKVSTPEDHARLHMLECVIMKVTRYVQNWDKGGHDDSLLDLSVYATMLRALDKDIRDAANELLEEVKKDEEPSFPVTYKRPKLDPKPFDTPPFSKRVGAQEVDINKTF